MLVCENCGTKMITDIGLEEICWYCPKCGCTDGQQKTPKEEKHE